ncbi:MAG: hypothetical protein AB1472_03015 [Candidatus Omnitrophota bacterium]
MNKRILILGLFLVLIITFVGCATPTLSTLQRRAIEGRDLEGNFDDAFKATLAVLQDRGFIIDHTDYDAGVIKATSGKKTGWRSVYSFNASVTIEQFGENNVKERIVFLQENKRKTKETSKIIEDPQYLQEIYEAIQKEMFIRKNLAK